MPDFDSIDTSYDAFWSQKDGEGKDCGHCGEPTYGPMFIINTDIATGAERYFNEGKQGLCMGCYSELTGSYGTDKERWD